MGNRVKNGVIALHELAQGLSCQTSFHAAAFGKEVQRMYRSMNAIILLFRVRRAAAYVFDAQVIVKLLLRGREDIYSPKRSKIISTFRRNH